MANVPPSLAGALPDRYVLERELGCGGMATVYLAHDLKHDRKHGPGAIGAQLLRDHLLIAISI